MYLLNNKSMMVEWLTINTSTCLFYLWMVYFMWVFLFNIFFRFNFGCFIHEWCIVWFFLLNNFFFRFNFGCSIRYINLSKKWKVRNKWEYRFKYQMKYLAIRSISRIKDFAFFSGVFVYRQLLHLWLTITTVILIKNMHRTV